MRNSAMRLFKGTIFALILGVTPVAGPLFAFDGAPATQDPVMPAVSGQPGALDALKKAVPPSTSDTSLTSLQYAAEEGHPVAQWKLGKMYADGVGVTQDDLRAFEYFSRIANAHAQYDLARLYLRGLSSSREDFRYGARWLGLAAQKGQHQAQAMLGQMLFNGDQLPRQAARGLMWLTLARDSATPDETWIKESYNKAIAKASDDDRAMALQMLEHWVQGRKD